MKRRVRWRGAAAAVLALGGLLAAAYALNMLRSRQTIRPGPDANQPVPRSAELLPVADTGAGQIAERAASVIELRAAESSVRNGESLAADASAILAAWLGGGAGDYLGYLAEAGCEPPPAAVWKDPTKREEIWLSFTRPLREASFDPSAIRIRTSYESGRPVAHGERIARAWGSRFDKISGIDRASASDSALQAAGLRVEEVLIPVRLRGQISGDEFNGMLGLSYGWDAVQSQWTLVEVSIYGVPNGDSAIIPPF